MFNILTSLDPKVTKVIQVWFVLSIPETSAAPKKEAKRQAIPKVSRRKVVETKLFLFWDTCNYLDTQLHDVTCTYWYILHID